MEIGGHTTHHHALASISPAEQADELISNLDYLKNVTGKKPRALAYPFGSNQDFNQASVQLAQQYFDAAFTTVRGQITEKTNCYQIPRFVVKNWPVEEFSRKIKTFFLKP